MTRNRMALLAAALVLILISGVLVGTRLLNRPTAEVPAGHSQINQAEVMQLLARPLQIKTIAPTAPCPNGPEDRPTTTYGPGPIYELPGPARYSAWGQYGDVTILTPVGDRDLVVQRGIDVRTGERMVFLPPFGTGSVSGTDTVNGVKQSQYTAAVIDTAHAPSSAALAGYGLAAPFQHQFQSSNYLAWSWWQGISKNSTLCLGYQIDSPGFSEVFYSAPGNY